MSDRIWLKAQHQWVDLPERRSTLGVEDAEKTPFTSVIIDVQVVDFQTQKLENTLGSNGIHRCKKLSSF
jgi:hypothetical protein